MLYYLPKRSKMDFLHQRVSSKKKKIMPKLTELQ